MLILDFLFSNIENTSQGTITISHGSNKRMNNVKEDNNLRGCNQSALNLDRLGNMLRFV